MKRLATSVVVALCLLLLPGAAGAQDAPSTDQVPSQDIVPRPNSGAEPDDAGDRGGALQLLVLVLIVGAIGFGVWRLSREVRATRTTRPDPGDPPPG